MNNPRRYCFVRDGHGYLIPANLSKTFRARMEAEDHDYINKKFGQYRCGPPEYFTFADPKYVEEENDE